MTCSGSFEADDVTSHAKGASLCYGTDEWEFFCCCFYCPIIFMRFLLLYFPFEEVFRLAFRILCLNSREYRATEGNCCPNLHLTRSAPALPFDRDFSVLEFIFAFPSFLHNWMNEPTLCLFNVCLLLLRAVTGWNASLGLERNRQLGSLIGRNFSSGANSRFGTGTAHFALISSRTGLFIFLAFTSNGLSSSTEMI